MTTDANLTSPVLPLMTLHPVSDAQNRWRAVLIETSAPLTANQLLPALAHWLNELGLRESLGNVPWISPPLAGNTLTEADIRGVGGGPLLLRVSLPDNASEAALAQLLTQLEPFADSLRVLLDRREPTTQLPGVVQGLVRHGATSDAPQTSASGPHLAIGISTGKDAITTRAAGWQWLCGNYPQEASASPGRSSSGRSIMLKLLSQITLDADDADIEKTLKHDPGLSFQLLRLVNSVAMSARAPITTFRQAIATIGRRQLQRWLQLLLYAQQGDTPPNPLMPIAAWRAGMMETLASTLGMNASEQDAAFMVGMFSRLDVLFAQPLSEILAPLGLQTLIVDALLARSGKLAPLLGIVEVTEHILDPDKNAADTLTEALRAAGLDHAQWCQIQAHSMKWALQICREL